MRARKSASTFTMKKLLDGVLVIIHEYILLFVTLGTSVGNWESFPEEVITVFYDLCCQTVCQTNAIAELNPLLHNERRFIPGLHSFMPQT